MQLLVLSCQYLGSYSTVRKPCPSALRKIRLDILMNMRKLSIRFFFQFLVSILLVLGLTWILDVLKSYLSTSIIALLFLIPVVISASYLNLTGGISASFAAFLCFNYFFVPPYHTLSVHQTQDFLALIIFLMVAVMFSQSLSQAKIGMETSVARERETTILYELNVALAGSNQMEEILRIVGEKISGHFPVEAISIDLQQGSGQAYHLVFPENVHIPNPPAGINLEIIGGGNNYGTIKIWLTDSLDHS
jgi:K+-sensing histidine kinase KdpD